MYSTTAWYIIIMTGNAFQNCIDTDLLCSYVLHASALMYCIITSLCFPHKYCSSMYLCTASQCTEKTALYCTYVLDFNALLKCIAMCCNLSALFSRTLFYIESAVTRHKTLRSTFIHNDKTRGVFLFKKLFATTCSLILFSFPH